MLWGGFYCVYPEIFEGVDGKDQVIEDFKHNVYKYSTANALRILGLMKSIPSSSPDLVNRIRRQTSTNTQSSRFFFVEFLFGLINLNKLA